MRVIAFIEDPDVIKKILNHLDLWLIKRKPQPNPKCCVRSTEIGLVH